jgi:hypothetical protein
VEGEADRVVGGRIAGVQRGDDVDPPGQRWRLDGVLDAQPEEGHARETEPAARLRERSTSSCARLDAVDVATSRCLKKRS